jgi:putative ABC transport system permease protein
VIINESLARRFWPQYPSGPDSIGQHMLVGPNPQPKEIVGISADVRHATKAQDLRPGIYLPCAQKPPQSAMVAVRTNGDPLSLANAVRRQILAIDLEQPVSDVATMDDIVEASEGQLRLMMRLLGHNVPVWSTSKNDFRSASNSSLNSGCRHSTPRTVSPSLYIW